jgi:predicted RNA-binding Zn ribbon-like protein
MALTGTTTSRAGSLPLVGGVLALDFCNTSSGRGTQGHIEHLLTGANVLTWARHAGVLDAGSEARLRDRCEADERLGRHLLTRAARLREAIYGLVADLAAGREADRRHLDAVGEAYARCLATGRLTTQNGGFGWTWSPDDTPEDAVLGPIAVSAMAIVKDADRARLKQCEGHHCGWLFLDTTKSNNRRWCEMEVCGNRAKQKRMRRRNTDAPT